MKRIIPIILGAAAIVSLSSCSRKNFVYLNDMQEHELYPTYKVDPLQIHDGDRLAIKVSCSNSPELAIPFNVQSGNYSISSDGAISAGEKLAEDKGYLVDANGLIEFPLLGKLAVKGMTEREVEELIKSKIISGGYIKDPLVTVGITNFKYTVLGAAGSGVYTVEDGTITLLEAIAKAGDLAINARLDRVCVLRDVGGSRVMYYNDIRKKEILSSPCYYLQQNDIIYVEPRYRRQNALEGTRNFLTTIMSIGTTLGYIAVLLRK